MQSILKENTGRKAAVLTLGALGYALLFSLGSQIDQTGATELGTTLTRFALAFPIAWIVLAALLGVLMPKMKCVQREEKKPFCTWGAFLLFFACYTPMLLIEFPGTFQYDVTYQMFQVSYGEYTQFHPLANTLLLKFCVDLYPLLQSMEKCALVIVLIQMVTVCACFALTCSSISRACSRRAARIATAFFALCPYHWVFASSFVKDVMFSTFFALFVAYMLEYIRMGGLDRLHTVLCVIAGMMACLLRNNMIYAMGVWVALLLLFGRGIRRGACLALLAAVLSVGVNQGLVAMMNAGPGDVREMLSVPMQQLARAYRYSPESFTEEDRQTMDVYLREESYKNYDETLADPVKFKFNSEVFLADKAGFFKLWADVGMRCPEIYLDAFLHTALPFLYPYARYDGSAKYIEVGMDPHALTLPFGDDVIIQPRRFEAIRNWLHKNIFETGARDIPVLRWVFNAGLVIWLMLLGVLEAMYSGEWKRFGILLLPVLLWGTYLLGPVMQGRYLYPFVCVLPLLFVIPKTEEVEKIDV